MLAGCGRLGFDPALDASSPPIGRANFVFATSTLHDGALGDPDGADAICATTAASAGLDGTFVAWIAGAPIERHDGSRGWTRVDGTPVADLPADFLTGAMVAPIATDELGHDLAASATPDIWTGIAADGSLPDSCLGWTTNAAGSTAMAGDALAGGSSFTAVELQTCDMMLHVACLQIGLVTPVIVTAPSTGRFAFISSETWVPAGLASADAVCQLDAQQAGLRGTFLAALPTSTASPASRFDLSGPAWTRTDGVALGPTAISLFDAATLPAMINRRADRTVIAGAFWWAGEPESATDQTCTDWTATSPQNATIGNADASEHVSMFAAATDNCMVALHLLCLQN